MLELIGVGYADEDFAGAEADFIKSLASDFNINTEKAEQMDQWIKQVIALTLKAVEDLLPV